MRTGPLILASASLTLAIGQAHAIGLGNLDDFEDETTQGWSIGPAGSGLEPTNTTGGQGGADDNYIEYASLGGGGPGSRQIIFNRDARWTGDYIAAGVNKIRVNLFNTTGGNALTMGVAIKSGTGRNDPCWVTTVASGAALAADSTWGNYEFLIEESFMEASSGTTDSFADVASNVVELRILALEGGASCFGEQVLAVVGFDDIQSSADSDLDGINDEDDNCTLAANPRVCIDITDPQAQLPVPALTDQTSCEMAGFNWGQPDTDADLYGNACDGDIAPRPGPFLSGDCSVGFADLASLKTAFFANAGDANYNADADFDFNGSIGFTDLASMKAAFFGTPGPGLGNCGCAPDPGDLGVNAEFDGKQMFIRGGLALNWGAVDQINNFADLGGGTYQARVRIRAGSYGYKVADDGWTLEYTNEDEPTVVGTTINLPGSGENSSIDIAEDGCYQFDVEADPGMSGTVPAPDIDLTVIRVGD